MDDQFFAKLREIQKKERANSSLARVGTDFYKRTHTYLDSIRDVARNDPFSNESDLLKNVQRIATEICEIREHKIADAAVMNIHRSYHLFQGKPQFDLVDTTPLNITEEEEALYFSFIDVLKNHRRGISLDQLNNHEIINDSNENEIDNTSDSINNSSINNSNANTNTNNENIGKNITKDNENQNFDVKNKTKVNKDENIVSSNNSNNYSNDKERIENDEKDDLVLNRLNSIKSGKIIKYETPESIEKQIIKSKYPKNNITDINNHNAIKSSINNNKNSINKKNFTNNIKTTNNNDNIENRDSSKNNSAKPKSKISNIIGNENDQFIDLDHLDSDIGHYNLEENHYNKFNSKSTADRIANVMVLIFSEINSIIGVDKKVYGPFQPQDIVIMPDINAKILIKNKKGRLVKV
ncbi:hypothetical protein KQY27_00520 [Methanobrevibacter sp. TMH8]|uniref:DNA replication complex subunit Gins51 n=1 Tax=Methanobrevibacter sp. TMH8 TaxID=2848611 RepID=UPI001CC9CCD3|nr:hypothetical protein [Methanobrevibacter sp. TMH8]MBZ9570037.1 hypothetical protein [Methanobrevibacter sp. TMH8]